MPAAAPVVQPESLQRTRYRSSTPGPANFDPEQLAVVSAAVQAEIVSWGRRWQLQWLTDDAKLKAAVVARQSGKSALIGVEAPLLALDRQLAPDHVQTLISSGQKKANSLLEKVTWWTDKFDKVAKATIGSSIYASPPSKTEIRLNPWGHIISEPANARTLAGGTGDFWLDELSKIMDDVEVFGAVMPFVSSRAGYRGRVTGTYWGDSGVFFDIMTQRAGGVNASKVWSLHDYDLRRVIADGDPRDYETEKSRTSPELFQQDFENRPLADANSAFPKRILDACAALRLPPHKNANGVDVATLQRAIGVDVGRTNDLSAVCWVVEHPTGMFRVEKVITWEKMPFRHQRERLNCILGYGRGGPGRVPGHEERVGYVHAAEIDSSGLGMQLAEELRDEFPAVVTCLPFTGTSKRELINGLLSACETGHVQIPDEPEFESLRSALRAIRRTFLPGGEIRYEAARTEAGHADEAIALALAVKRLRSGRGDWGVGAPAGDEKSMGLLAKLSGAVTRSPEDVLLPTSFGATNFSESDLREFRRLQEVDAALRAGVELPDEEF